MKIQFLRGITTFYLLVPSFLFLYGWLKLPFAIIAIVIVTTFLLSMLLDARGLSSNWKSELLTADQRPISPVMLSGLVFVALFLLVWVAFSGAGGIGYQNSDYRASNALLKDLIVQDWPSRFTMNNGTVHLVYYVAYFLPAAAVGKMCGWTCANVFLFIWTWVGVLLAFAWFCSLSRVQLKNDVGKLWKVALIFCLAGGLDYFGYYVLNDQAFALGTQIESWPYYFQYSSNTTLLYWVPQHTIAAWLLTGMIGDALYNKHSLHYLGMAVAGGTIWSPFGAVGMAPYLLLLLFIYLQSEQREYLFHWKSLIFNSLSAGLASVYLLYLGSNQFKFPIGSIWQTPVDHETMVTNLLSFWFLEFALLACLVLLFILLGVAFSRSRRTRPSWQERIQSLDRQFGIPPIQLFLFLLSLAVLWILPYFRMGIKNDLVMRGSIPSLFIFWAVITKVAADASFRVRVKYNSLYVLIWMILIVGFFPAITAIVNSARAYHLGPPAFADVQMTTEANTTDVVLQRMGNENTIFFHYLSK